MDLLVGAFCFLLQRFSVKPSLRLEDLPSFNRGCNLRRRFSQCNRWRWWLSCRCRGSPWRSRKFISRHWIFPLINGRDSINRWPWKAKRTLLWDSISYKSKIARINRIDCLSRCAMLAVDQWSDRLWSNAWNKRTNFSPAHSNRLKISSHTHK